MDQSWPWRSFVRLKATLTFFLHMPGYTNTRQTHTPHTHTQVNSQRAATSHTVWLFQDGYVGSSNFIENQARINIITQHSPEGQSKSSGGYYANSIHNPMLIYFIELKQRLLFDPRDLPFFLWVSTVSSNPFSRRVCQEYKLIKQD